MPGIEYWVWLAEVKLPAVKKAMLARYRGGAEQVYRAGRMEYESCGYLTRGDIELLMNKDLTRTNTILDKCDTKDIRIIRYDDELYPERLRNISDAPVLLYFRGSFPNFDELLTIAVIGTRKATPEGIKIAERIGRDLANSGTLVLSGMALGIDSAATEGALKSGHTAAVVLGSGIDVPYPSEKKSLYRDLCFGGTVISEYPPETPPYSSNFPARNRIISGLSCGVVVVEAGKHSGSTITVERALEQGRDVYAVPGSLFSEMSTGTNELLKQGARPVTMAWDVLQDYAAVYPHIVESILKDVPLVKKEELRLGDIALREIKTEELEEISEKPKKILGKKLKSEKLSLEGFTDLERDIIVSISDIPLQPDEIEELIGASTAEIMSALTMLELRGAMERLPGNRYRPDPRYRELAGKKNDANGENNPSHIKRPLIKKKKTKE
jgi:DNA processing protein